MKKFLQIGRKKPEYYKGILIKADLGLHNELQQIICSRVQPGTKILDLGAGEGALSQRLIDLGYQVVSADLIEADFKAENKQFYRIDFNNSQEVLKFKNTFAQYFDVVLGIEVIEHVENPWEYIRTLKSLLKDNGLLVLSTPNITSWLSRLFFLFKGQFLSFDSLSLEYGHINPVSSWEIETILKAEKFEDIHFRPGGTLPDLWITTNRFYWWIYFLSLFFRPLMKGISRGWCLIITAQKTDISV